MTFKPAKWTALAVGDLVRLRPKRTPGDRLEVTVADLLEHDRADGAGFIDEDHTTYRQWYYDLEISVDSPLSGGAIARGRAALQASEDARARRSQTEGHAAEESTGATGATTA